MATSIAHLAYTVAAMLLPTMLVLYLRSLAVRLCMLVQNDAEVRVRDVGGSLERVKNVTVNLHALTTHTLAAMEQECQVASCAAGHSHSFLPGCILAPFTV